MIYKSYLIEQNFDLIKSNLTLFFGENLGLQNDFKDIIRKKFHKTEIYTVLQDEILKNSEHFFNEILNGSLFDNDKIYFINQVDDKILNFIEELESKVGDQKIFIFAGILEKRSKLRSVFEKSAKCGTVACYQDNEITIKKIIVNKLKNLKGLSTENINIIIDNSGLDRNKLNNELNKILTFFDGKLVDRRNLELLLNIKTNDDFALLRDEAINGNKIRTNKLLNDTFIEQEKNIFYLNLIYKRLEKLLKVLMLAEHSNLESAINEVKPPIFWKDKPIFSNQLNKWNKSKIKSFLTTIYELELKIKSSSFPDGKVLIKKLIVDMCNLANA
jgi:DNA polymerase-3 subunit delta